MCGSGFPHGIVSSALVERPRRIHKQEMQIFKQMECTEMCTYKYARGLPSALLLLSSRNECGGKRDSDARFEVGKRPHGRGLIITK